MLRTQGCFSYCWAALAQSQEISAPHPAPPTRGLGVHKELGRDTVGIKTIKLSKDNGTIKIKKLSFALL